ncbi:YggT family protein [Thiobacter aerophilum]|uniref:YggT family protein n=1 Tax=Thiobacter aerophilum TaxID=3121275 RepID=A0ABV0EGU9_9BURK
MLSQAVIFLLDTVVTAFIALLLLRFYLQLLRVPQGNPLTPFVVTATNFLVLPLRRVIPGLWGLDLATLVAAWFMQWLLALAVEALSGLPLARGSGLMYLGFGLWAAVELLRMSLYLLMLVQVMLFVVSLVNPFSPFMAVLEALSRPFTRQVRRVIPPIANVDLSPMVILIVCQLVLMLPVAWLEQAAKEMIHAGMGGFGL